MIWALDPVTDGPDSITTKAPFVMDTLHYMQQMYDFTLNMGLEDDNYPRIHSFTRRDDDGNYYILVNSESIFENVPFASSGSPVKLDKSSIGSGLFITNTHNASTSGHVFHARTPPSRPHDLTLAHLPDPNNRYSSIHSIAADVKLKIPNGSKLVHGSLVDIVVTCCMLVPIFVTFAAQGFDSGQLILHKMALIPSSYDSADALFALSPSATAAPNDHITPNDPVNSSASNVQVHPKPVCSDGSPSTVTTGSEPFSTAYGNVTMAIDAMDTAPITPASQVPTSKTMSIPTTSLPTCAKVASMTHAGKKRVANATKKTGNIMKSAQLSKEKDL
ncbi:hypothetical protein K439DRAFT_1620045 [Ramaria rubella]|nr:hypothetical protein K439DRAFT_1620045 [Ramaria rubella]